jgi:TPR repeat protein
MYEAVRLIKGAAHHSVFDAPLTYALALLESGRLTEAAKWAEFAARRKNSAAELLYAKCLRDGIGVPRNLAAAAIYFKRSADPENATRTEVPTSWNEIW